MLDTALGELRLTPKQFWSLTPAEFDASRRGHERSRIHRWQETRWLGTLLVNLQRGADDAPMEPSELMPLPGDEDFASRTAPEKVLTQEEKAAREARILERSYSTPLTT